MKRIITFAAFLAMATAQAAGTDLLGTLQHEDGETLLDLDTTLCKSGTAARWSTKSKAIRVGCWDVASDRPNQILIFWLDTKKGTYHSVSEVISLKRSDEIWRGRGRLGAKTDAEMLLIPNESSFGGPAITTPSRPPEPTTRSRSMAELGYGVPASPAFPPQVAPPPPSHLYYSHRLSPSTSVLPDLLGNDPYVYRRP